MNQIKASPTASLKNLYYRDLKVKISIIFLPQFQQFLYHILYNLLFTIKYGIIFKFKKYNQIINNENEYIWKEEREEGKNFQKDISL